MKESYDRTIICPSQVKLWTRENWAEFWDADEQTTKTGLPKKNHVPKPHLRLVGSGSVMEALFKGRGPPEIPLILWVCDDMIAVQINQADTGVKFLLLTFLVWLFQLEITPHPHPQKGLAVKCS